MDITGMDSVTTVQHSKLTNAGSVTQAKPSAAPLPKADNTTQETTAPALSALKSNESSSDNQHGQKKLQSAVEKIQEFVSATASDIEFSIDKESGQTVVKVIDRETEEVIRQIPSQEMLDLANALDKLQGILIRQKA